MLPLFLEIARNPNTGSEALRTVRRLKQLAASWVRKDAATLSDEEAYSILESKTLVVLWPDPEQFEQVSDLSPLAGFTQISELLLYRNRVESLEPLSGLVGMRKLNLQSNLVRTLAPLRSLSLIQELVVYDNPLEDFQALSDLPSLRKIEISSDQAVAFGSVGALNQVQRLKIHGILPDFRVLPEMPSLRSLWVESCNSLAGIEKFRELKSLSAYRGIIDDISPLAHLTRLTHLHIAGNQIVDLKPLASLTQLREAILSANKIASVEPLKGLPLLHVAYFYSNPVEDAHVKNLCASLSSWDVEFGYEGPPRNGSLALTVVKESDFEFHNGRDSVADYDSIDYDMLSSEYSWMVRKIEEALNGYFIPEGDYEIPEHSSTSRNIHFLIQNHHLRAQLRTLVCVLQRLLAGARNDFVVNLETEVYGRTEPHFKALVTREKVVVPEEYELLVRDLLSAPMPDDWTD